MSHTDSYSRLIEASPAEIFAALEDPDALLAWLPPEGMRASFEAFDLRPGGSYRMVLTYEDPTASKGKTHPDSDTVECHFVEIVPGVRMATTVHFLSNDPAFRHPMTLTWQLTPEQGRTRVTLVAGNVPDAISAADHAAGMASSLANLARFLAG